MKTSRVGVIGCGNISGIYFENLTRYEAIEVVACADLDQAKAEQAATKYGIPSVLSTEDLLNSADIEFILNLTVPKAHFAVATAAVEAGKHVYNEKPLTVTRSDGRKLMLAAQAKGVRVGCAPDTFLGAGIQTCRELIDSGAIGEPVAAQAFMLCRGHETWHPSPEFYYEVGGGPMLDMGPYYLTALVNLMGPIRRVTGSAHMSFPTRTITSEPKKGKVVTVETPTHIAGVVDFASGAVGSITTSFDVHGFPYPPIVVFGSEGTLEVPDPNTFGGTVRVRRKGSQAFEEVAVQRAYAQNSRGVGLLDMALAQASGRPHRASGDLALHVLDVMEAFNQASEENEHVAISSGVERPDAMPVGELKE